MDRIKILLPKGISGSVEIGQLFRVQSVDDQVVLVSMPDAQALLLSREAEFMDPEIYVGSNWDGLSFEIPAAHVHRFLVSLGRALQPEKITIYFKQNGSEEVLTSSLDGYEAKLTIAGEQCLDHSFMVEFDEHTLFTGGGRLFLPSGGGRASQSPANSPNHSGRTGSGTPVGPRGFPGHGGQWAGEGDPMKKFVKDAIGDFRPSPPTPSPVRPPSSLRATGEGATPPHKGRSFARRLGRATPLPLLS